MSRRFPEHVLQTQIRAFVREAIDAPCSFQCFDRSQNHSGKQHLWEKNRGIRAGQPDTLLIYNGHPVYCELKTPGNKPSPAQEDMAREIECAGGRWFWADSVVGYMDGLERFGVPLRRNARLIALHRDGLFQSYLLKGKAPAKPRARALRSGVPSSELVPF